MIKYSRIMEKVFLSEEAEMRIMTAIHRCDIQKLRQKTKTRFIKGITAAAACAVICAVSINLIADKHIQNPPADLGAQGSVTEYKTVSDLASSLDYSLMVPDVLPEGYSYALCVNQFGMAQIIYKNGENEFKYYMEPAQEGEIDYSQYENTKTEDGITLAGNADGWLEADTTDGKFTYSFISDVPLKESDFINTAKSLKAYGK